MYPPAEELASNVGALALARRHTINIVATTIISFFLRCSATADTKDDERLRRRLSI
jgi:hypothetical protein